ncbi:hypothetical protein CK203_019820 [Vitis vinifera]|uniref:Methyltransferase n=1 Tax=Vitis vinifera TaxID=29760 RepID=A0A438J364_VITVI|nr:hypothetical protein CK203_019820 [Vitis vinifera]
MGSVSLKIGDGTARFRRASLCSSAVNVLMLFSVITTNLFALYAFTSSPKDQAHPTQHTHKNISFISEQVSLIIREIESSQKKLAQMEKELLGYESIDLSRPNTASELKLFLQRHQLPLGKDSKTGITEMVASVGHSCDKSVDLLSQYMTYKVSGACPDDWSLAQRLILRGCEPLPRRRCFAKSVPKRFVKARGKNDFLIDDVLALGSGGTRTGFDIGGGSGTFAARMAERNVTVITATLNVDAPISEFVSARGLFPLYLSLDHRFPFYDNDFKAGGLFWLDNFYCANEEKKKALTRLIERFGYRKLKWVVGEKPDAAGPGKSEVYLSGVLQKPRMVSVLQFRGSDQGAGEMTGCGPLSLTLTCLTSSCVADRIKGGDAPRIH